MMMYQRKRFLTKALIGIFLILGLLYQGTGNADANRVEAANSTCQEICHISGNETVTKKIDVTGDGKKDKIKIQTKACRLYGGGIDCSCVESVTVSVNGHKALQIKGLYEYRVKVCYVKQSTKKEFLWIETFGNNEDSEVDALYEYNKSTKKLKKVVDLQESTYGDLHRKIIKLQVSKSDIKVTYNGMMVATGYTIWTDTFVYQNGKFYKKNKTAKVMEVYKEGTFTKNKEFVANTSVKFYKEPGSNKKSFTLQRGRKATLEKICVRDGKYYLQFKSGKKTGWIYAEQFEIFQNVYLAG